MDAGDLIAVAVTDHALTANAVRVYAWLVERSSVTASYAEIGEQTAMGESAAKAAVKLLVERGYANRTRMAGKGYRTTRGDLPAPPIASPAVIEEAKHIADSYWEWVRAQAGHPPTDIKFGHLLNVIRDLLAVGWPRLAIKEAMAGCYHQGRTPNAANLQVWLDGRVHHRRPTGLVDDLLAIAAEDP